MTPLHMFALAKALLRSVSQTIPKAGKISATSKPMIQGAGYLPLNTLMKARGSSDLISRQGRICFSSSVQSAALQKPFLSQTHEASDKKVQSCSALRNNSESSRGRWHEVREDGDEERCTWTSECEIRTGKTTADRWKQKSWKGQLPGMGDTRQDVENTCTANQE